MTEMGFALTGIIMKSEVCILSYCLGLGNKWIVYTACFNPLRAKFFRENINIYLHFMSFLYIYKTQVVEIPPWVKQGPAYST